MKKIIYLILLTLWILACTEREDEEFIDIIETSGTFIDSRDNHEYKWVKIGNQIWMAENLAYLPAVNHVKPDTSIMSHYYIYGHDSTDVNAAKATYNYDTYGVLYDCSAALISCPAGWHLPSDAEWKQLEIDLGMTQAQVNESVYPYYRGTDIPNVDFVVNYDLPEVPENYVHRVGRTGRGTKKGQAVSFCSSEEKETLEEIESFPNKEIIPIVL